MKVSRKLRLIQKYSGKTQEQLAHELGVSFVTLNSWINGKSQPRKTAVEKIDLLYTKIFGDTSVGMDVLNQKTEKLTKLQRQLPNPFRLIMTRKDLYDDLLLLLTYHTNSIEGSTFSESEVRVVLFDDVIISNKSVREHQEVKNHQHALGFVMKWVEKGNEEIDENLIKRIHQILMNGIMSNAGIYRNHGVRIVGSYVPTSNYLSIKKHMAELMVVCNQRKETLLEKVKQIAYVHSRFEQIHPFSDGNGRVGRLLMLILAFRYGFAPAIVRRERKQAYYTYLEEAQMKNNITPLVSFVFDALFEGYRLLMGSLGKEE